jgi:hypothetical protein
MSEFVTDGENGLLVARYRDAKALADTLRRATTDTELAHRLRANARAAALPFGKPAVDAREAEIYAETLPEEPRRPVPAKPGRTDDLPGEVQLHLRTPDLRATWDDIVRTSPDAWVFHTDDWQQCQLAAYPLQDLSLVVEWRGRPAAVFPLQRHAHQPHVLHSTFMGTGGPALAGDLSRDERAELLRIMHGLGARLLRQGVGTELRVLLPQLSATSRAHWPSFANPLVAHGYRLASTSTSLIDLTQDQGVLFANLRPRHRQSIKKAKQLDVEITRLTGQDGMDAYYRLHVETYERTGVPPHPKSYFDAIAEHMIARGHAETFAAWLDGELVAAANVATFGDGSLYWTGAYSQRGLDSDVGKLLQWQIIVAQQQQGLAWHETGEVFPDAAPGTKERGLTTYKTGFGGIQRPWFKGSLFAQGLTP